MQGSVSISRTWKWIVGALYRSADDNEMASFGDGEMTSFGDNEMVSSDAE